MILRYIYVCNLSDQRNSKAVGIVFIDYSLNLRASWRRYIKATTPAHIKKHVNMIVQIICEYDRTKYLFKTSKTHRSATTVIKFLSDDFRRKRC